MNASSVGVGEFSVMYSGEVATVTGGVNQHWAWLRPPSRQNDLSALAGLTFFKTQVIAKTMNFPAGQTRRRRCPASRPVGLVHFNEPQTTG
jgi:hypothetical protein